MTRLAVMPISCGLSYPAQSTCQMDASPMSSLFQLFNSDPPAGVCVKSPTLLVIMTQGVRKRTHLEWRGHSPRG
jgi:hypothetical protein